MIFVHTVRTEASDLVLNVFKTILIENAGLDAWGEVASLLLLEYITDNHHSQGLEARRSSHTRNTPTGMEANTRTPEVLSSFPKKWFERGRKAMMKAIRVQYHVTIEGA